MHTQRVLVVFVVCLCSAWATGVDDNEINNRGVDAGSLLEKITSTLMSRSGSSTSQVLSLNLTNLLILVLLKALIFAAGSIGAGGWKGGHGGYGHRSADASDSENRFISDSEILLYLGYLAGSPGKYDCLQNVACNRPSQATQYVKAGGLLLKAASIIPRVVEVDEAHEKTLRDLKKAAEFGQEGGDCNTEFVCADNRRK